MADCKSNWHRKEKLFKVNSAKEIHINYPDSILHLVLRSNILKRCKFSCDLHNDHTSRAETFPTFRSSDLYLAMCSVAFVLTIDVVWLSWANVYPSKYLQVPGSCVSGLRMEHIYTFDANTVIIVKFIYLPVFTYLLISSWIHCLQCTFLSLEYLTSPS